MLFFVCWKKKNIISDLSWVFEGPRLFWPQNCPALRSEQFGGQKSLGPSKKLQKSPMVCFARIKNNLPHDKNEEYILKVNRDVPGVSTLKKDYRFSRPQSGCHLLIKKNSIWPGIIKLFPARESLVSDILAGDGNTANLFYSVRTQC